MAEHAELKSQLAAELISRFPKLDYENISKESEVHKLRIPNSNYGWEVLAAWPRAGEYTVFPTSMACEELCEKELTAPAIAVRRHRLYTYSSLEIAIGALADAIARIDYVTARCDKPLFDHKLAK